MFLQYHKYAVSVCSKSSGSNNHVPYPQELPDQIESTVWCATRAIDEDDMWFRT